MTVTDPLGDGSRTNVFSELPLVGISGWTGLTSGCNTSVLAPLMEAGIYQVRPPNHIERQQFTSPWQYTPPNSGLYRGM